MKRGKLLIPALFVSSLALGGCAPSMSGNVYSRDQARKATTLEEGAVVSVREVMIEGTKTPIGALGGGAVGGVLGSMVGGGKGSTLGAVVGALAGAGAGAVAEEKITQQKGLEIQVKLDSGQQLVVVQAADQMYQPGQRVKVLRSPDGTTRVTSP